jgi:hypothetical protein
LASTPAGTAAAATIVADMAIGGDETTRTRSKTRSSDVLVMTGTRVQLMCRSH